MPTVADYDQQIAASEAMTRWLRRQRKSLVMSTKAKLQHKDPAWEANFRNARKRASLDPAKAALESDRKRQAALSQWVHDRRTLPKMSNATRYQYRILRDAIGREAALAQMFPHSAGRSAPQNPAPAVVTHGRARSAPQSGARNSLEVANG